MHEERIDDSHEQLKANKIERKSNTNGLKIYGLRHQ